MFKYASLLMALSLGTAWIHAETPEANRAATSTEGVRATRDADGKVKGPDGIARVRDTTLYLKKGEVTRVNNELKLSEGIIARPSGEVVLPGGKTVKLEEGQMVTLDGKLTQAPIGLGSTAPGSASTNPPDTGAKTKYGNGLPPVK